MFGLDLNMRNQLKDFDSGMWFLSFLAAMAMTLPVALLQPGVAFGRRSFVGADQADRFSLNAEVFANIVQHKSNE